MPKKKDLKFDPAQAGSFLKDLFRDPGAFNWKWALTLTLGAFLTGFLMLEMERFKWLGAPFIIPQPFWAFLWVLGLGLFILGFRALPRSPRWDLPRWAAYPLLAAILAIAAFIRFYRADQVYLAYWDDPATFLTFFLRVCDFHNFLIIYPEGATEPLYVWAGGLLWMLFPGLKALVLQRITANLFSLASIWVFYRLGREISGKRTVGLLGAAILTASKPLLIHTICGQNALTIPLSIGLYLWFQLRVFRKPDLSHFLQWGLVLGIGLYTYNAIRTWYLYLILVSLGWLLYQRFKGMSWKEWKWPAPVRFRSPFRDRLDQVTGPLPGVAAPWLVGAFALFYLAFLLDHVLFVFHANPLSKLWGFDIRIWCLLQALFAVLFFQAYRAVKKRDQVLYAWALGVLVAGVLSHPLALHTEAASRIGNISLLPKSPLDWLSPAFFNRIWGQVHMAYQFLFTVGSDRTDMNVFGDPVFDYHGEVLVVLGLAAFLARPSWIKGLLVVGLPVGIAPFLLTSDPHGAKLLGGVLPLALLASMALGSWITAALDGVSWKKVGGIVLALGFLAFWAWEIQGTWTRVYDVWWNAVVNDDLAVGQEVDKALPGNRVYVAACQFPGERFYSAYVQAVLHDGNPVYVLEKENPIPVFPGGTPKDVVLVISGHCNEELERVRKEYPSAVWTPHWQFYQKSKDEVPFLYSIHIPAGLLRKEPRDLFCLQNVGEGDWIRRFYLTGFGLRGGMIVAEDHRPVLNPVDPQWALHAISGDGVWEAPVDGNYRFSMTNANPSRLWMDGKVLFQTSEEGKETKVSRELHLTKGAHRFRYFTYCMVGVQFPDVTIENDEIKLKKVLGGP